MTRMENEEMINMYMEKHHLLSLFSAFDRNQIYLHHFRKEEMIISAGDTIEEMLFLVDGKVKIFTMTDEDKRLILRFQKALAVLGDIEFVDDDPAVSSVEASTDCIALGISYKNIRKAIGDNPIFLQFLLKSITYKFRTKASFTSLNVLYPVEVRFASYLLSISTDSEGSVFRDEMKNSSLADIADMIGTSYRHLNRVIQKLCQNQVVERVNGTIHIKDFKRLREIARDNIYE
ncbi:MAG: Crp/Fnr family transcriptional regulator [Bacillus sp. (in: firmicutes)]